MAFRKSLLRTLATLARISTAALLAMSTTSCAPAEPQGAPETSPVTETLQQHELIVGTWKAAPPANQDAFVDFSADGIYLASDGCNQIGGGWTLDSEGGLTVSGGAMTQVGCNNEPIPDYILSSAQATVDGNTLTLIDRDGSWRELYRVSDSEMSVIGTWAGSSEDADGAEITFSADGTWEGSLGRQAYSGFWELRFQPEEAILEVTDLLGSPAKAFIAKGSPLLVTCGEPISQGQECLMTGPSVAPIFPVWNGVTYDVYLSPKSLGLAVAPTSDGRLSQFLSFERVSV